MTTNFQQSNLNNLYKTDYHEWLEYNLNLLEKKLFDHIDLINIIEELASLGRAEKSALRSNLTLLLMHLLKWDYQKEKRSNSWRYTIIEHRRRILHLFKDSPSLKNFFTEILAETYQDAVADASEETCLPLTHFPSENPYSLEEIFNRHLESLEP
jgi:hypothetical protein